MLKFVGLGSETPKPVASDQIIPLHWFEDGFMWKKVIVYTLFVFLEPLDPEKLRESLDRVVQRDGYKKLGGRLRRNAQGRVEYHVPMKFDASRPAVTFSHVHHDMNASDHPISSKIPKPGNLSRPAVVGDPEELSDLMRPEGKTLSLEDYITTDRTTLGLHVTTFRDTTCLTLYWPHLAFDAMGKKAIIEAWTLALKGRDDEIPIPQGYDTDPLAEFGKHPTEPHILAERRVGNWGMGGYVLRNISSLAGPKEINMVCVPAAFWQKMVADVRNELEKEAEARGDAIKPFVTEGDVLVAWWTRLCSSHLGRDSSTTVAAQNAMSLRKVLGKDLLSPSEQPLLSMALGFPTVILPASEILQKPLSWLALQFRRAINDQGSRQQVEAYASLQREFSASLRMPLFFGDSGMYNLFFSNWQKAGLFDFDFSPAAVDNTAEKPVRASYIQCVQDPSFPEGWPISGKDEHGNYWISGFRAKGLWAKIEEQLNA